LDFLHIKQKLMPSRLHCKTLEFENFSILKGFEGRAMKVALDQVHVTYLGYQCPSSNPSYEIDTMVLIPTHLDGWGSQQHVPDVCERLSLPWEIWRRSSDKKSWCSWY
jgi:hypothetical protein